MLMAEDKDFNEVLEDIFLREETDKKSQYDEGFKSGSAAGNPEGYHLGYHRGAELGRELVPDEKMERTLSKLHQQIDSIVKYITPLLPLANCHMVEFLTHNHWDKLIPHTLRESLSGWKVHEAIENFWKIALDPLNYADSELGQWVLAARTHTVTSNNDYCLTVVQLEDRIQKLGGNVKPEIQIKEYLTHKKSYEVRIMSRLVAALCDASGARCCAEAGGGRGSLLAALSLAYGLPSLTIDCDQQLLDAAQLRTASIQKQWNAIAKRLNNGVEGRAPNAFNTNLHRFARAFVTRHTDLRAIVEANFPELSDGDVKVLLTGLHTCGNLGPESLRIFTSQPSTAAVLNVPCCYHLLTETTDDGLFDVFQKNFGSDSDHAQGFPMSEHLRGYNIGRNARMLAAQSIDRVVNLRQMPSRTLLYRALLQVLIKQHLPDRAVSEGKLKRLSKCENFEQYFKMADNILKLELFDKLTDSYLIDLCKDIEVQWKKLVIFYFLRLCLAQVVESVILLDRLLFLFENGYGNVYLVKLFDPVLSPRCYSIVAVR